MTPEPEDFGRLWREQRGEGPMSVDEIKARAKKLGRTIRMRNLREYAAAVVVIVVFAWWTITRDVLLIRIGALANVVAAAFVVYYLHTRSWMPADSGDQACLAFYRSELVRQRDLLRGVWWWYLLPFVPGLLLITIGRVAAEPALAPGAAIGTMIALLVFLGIGKLNDLAAKKIQQDLDALDR